MIYVRISQDRRGKYKTAEVAPLCLVVTKRNQRAMIPLRFSVKPGQWDSKLQKVKDCPNKDSINLLIEEKKLKAMKLLEQYRDEGILPEMSLVEIKNKIAGTLYPEREEKKKPEPPKLTFLSHMEKFMSRKTGGTLSVYNQTKSALKKHCPDIETLTFEDITVPWLRKFESDLAVTASKNARNIHLRNIRAIFNDAIDEDLITCYPFRKFKIRPEPTRKRSLSVEDLRKLFTLDVEPYAEIYRDMFKLIFMLIGINAVDLYNLTKITKDGRVEYTRAKTHRLYSIKVEPEARELIEKWEGKKGLLLLKDRWENHFSFLHQFNKSLRKLGAPIENHHGKKGDGLFPEISSYWARHTWATIARKIGVSKDTIAQALGHGQKTVTDIYIDEGTEMVDEANRLVLDWVLYGKKKDAPSSQTKHPKESNGEITNVDVPSPQDCS